jgi:glycerate dehydrogenase
MKIVFLDRDTLGKDISLERFKEIGELIVYETTTPIETLNRVKDADIVVTNKVVIDKDIMKNSNIKLICVAATGTNNIDIQEAKNRAIEVKNVAGYSTSSVAQVTFTLVLDLIHKIDYYKNIVSTGQWSKSPIFTNLDKPFFELENKNWGIIGLGSIGTKVANIAKSFGCNVNYYSTSGSNHNDNFKQVSLDELLEKSDIISIHAPLNDNTLNLLNSTNLNQIKDGAILVNTGRGGIINEKDLATIIDSKELYCGLDVLSEEPIREDNPLLKIRNKNRIIIVPHIGWASIEARNRLLDGVYKNILEYIS